MSNDNENDNEVEKIDSKHVQDSNTKNEYKLGTSFVFINQVQMIKKLKKQTQ